MSPPPPADEPTGFDPTQQFPPTAVGTPPPAPNLGHGNALPNGTYLGEFEILSMVGEGGFGIVYRAWDHSLKRQVAVKEYMPSSLAQRSGGLQVNVRSDKFRETFIAGLQSFVKEARMLAQFDHPALVKVYRFWEANGSAYMVMPFYEGITLRDELRQRAEAPDEATLLGWLGPVADALAVIHAEHWYHRDIAPDNVMLLAGSRRPLLLDFGAARRVIGDMTQALTVILKPGYAPVEQYAEIPGMKQGPWTDVYALAALAYFALRRRTPPPSVGRLVNDSFQPLMEVARGKYSDRVLQAIDHALAVRPEDRTPSVAAFKAELGLAAPASDFSAGVYPSSQPQAADLDLAIADFATTQLVARAPAPSTADLPTERLAPPIERTQRVQPPPPAPPAVAAPAPAPAVAATPVAPPQPVAALTAPASGSRRGLLVGAAAVVAVGGGAALFLRSPPTAAPPQAAAPVVAAPPPPTSAPVPLPSYDTAAIFARIVQGQTPGWGLDLTVPNTRLRMDRDKLVFTLRSLQDGVLFVFYQGADGQLQQLYPNTLTAPPRVAKGRELTLPQGGLEFNVAGPPGPAHLLVMVSRFPRDISGFAPRVEGGFTSFPGGSMAAALEAANSGRLPLLAGRPVCAAGAACDDEYGAAALTLEVSA